MRVGTLTDVGLPVCGIGFASGSTHARFCGFPWWEFLLSEPRAVRFACGILLRMCRASFPCHDSAGCLVGCALAAVSCSCFPPASSLGDWTALGSLCGCGQHKFRPQAAERRIILLSASYCGRSGPVSHRCTPIPKGEGDGGISDALESVRTGTP